MDSQDANVTAAAEGSTPAPDVPPPEVVTPVPAATVDPAPNPVPPVASEQPTVPEAVTPEAASTPTESTPTPTPAEVVEPVAAPASDATTPTPDPAAPSPDATAPDPAPAPADPAPADPAPADPAPAEPAAPIPTAHSNDAHPSIPLAIETGRKMMFREGKGKFFSTSTEQMGLMGVGIQLYFEILVLLCRTFFLMGMCSLPSFIFNYTNKGAGDEFTSTLFTKLSIGNAGFEYEVSADNCIGEYNQELGAEGVIDCTAKNQLVAGGLMDAATIAAWISLGEFLAILVLIHALIAASSLIKAIEKQVDEENAEAEDYTVFVRNLPPDTTIEDLTAHFSSLYDLSVRHDRFPCKLSPLGLSIRKAAWYFFVWSIFVAPIVSAIVLAVTDSSSKAGLAGVGSSFLVVLATMAVINCQGEGRLKTQRKLPGEEWDDWVKDKKAYDDKQRLKQQSKSGATVAPDLPPPPAASRYSDAFNPAIRPSPQPVNDITNTMNPVYLKSWVAEITLVHPNGEVIDAFMDNQAQMKQLQVMEAKFKHKADGGDAKAKAQLDSWQAKATAAEAKLLKTQDPSKANNVIGAFVTFNCESSCTRCVDDYDLTYNWYYRAFQPRMMRLKTKTGKKNACIRVERAEAPSLVFWQNLHISDAERFLRVLFTNSITVLLLLLSFVLIYLANLASKEAALMAPDFSVCEEVLPALFSGTENFTWGMNFTHDKSRDGECDDGSFFIGFQQLDYDDLPQVKVTLDGGEEDFLERDELLAAFSLLEEDADDAGLESASSPMCTTGCVPLTNDGPGCGSLGCAIENWKLGCDLGDSDYCSFADEVVEPLECTEYKPNAAVACFCNQVLMDTAANEGFGAAYDVLSKDEKEGLICTSFVENMLTAQVLGALAIGAVVIVNVALKSVLTMLVNFEKHASGSAHSRALTIKILFAQFLNTAIIALLVNAQLSPDHRDNWGMDGPLVEKLLDGQHKDYVRDWYVDVGAALCVTMLGQLFVPHGAPYVKGFIVRPLKIMLGKKSAHTQRQLDELFIMDRFEIETRYAVLLNYLLVVSMYGAAMPILFVFAGMNFGLSYVLDKYALLKLNKQPVRYDAQLAKMVLSLLPLVITLQLSTACYQFSTPILAEAADGEVVSIWSLPDEIGEGQDIVRIISVLLVSNPLSEGLQKAVTGEYHWLLEDIMPRVIRTNVLPLFLLLGVFLAVLILNKVFGDLFKRAVGEVFSFVHTYEFPAFDHQQPDFCAAFRNPPTELQMRSLEEGKQLPEANRDDGFFVEEEEAEWIRCRWLKEATGSQGVQRKEGDLKKAWEVMADAAIHNYDLSENPDYKFCYDFMVEKKLLIPNEGRAVISWEEWVKAGEAKETKAAEEEEKKKGGVVVVQIGVGEGEAAAVGVEGEQSGEQQAAKEEVLLPLLNTAAEDEEKKVEEKAEEKAEEKKEEPEAAPAPESGVAAAANPVKEEPPAPTPEPAPAAAAEPVKEEPAPAPEPAPAAAAEEKGE